MKTYHVYVRWSGNSQRETIKGKLYIQDNYYHIYDAVNEADYYFPIGRTTIKATE